MSAKNAGTIVTNKFPQFCYSILAGLSGIVIGMAVGWNSPATQLITKGNAAETSYFDENFDDTGASSSSSSSTDHDEDAIAWSTAGCYCLGTTAGGLVHSALANAIGCRLTVVAYDAIALAGWSIMLLIDACPAESKTVWIGRLVVGFGAGGLGLSTATYMTHAADFDIRGRVHIIHHAFVCFGVLTSYTLGPLLSYFKFIVACAAWPLLHLFAALFLPESPCYLYKDNSPSSKVKSAMRMLKGNDFDVDSSYCALRKYMESLDVRSSCGSFDTAAEAQLKRRVRRIVVAGIGLAVFQQSCGAGAAMFHAREIFGRLGPPGLTDTPTRMTNFLVILSAIQVLSCLVSVELTEIAGRKSMLIASALGMGLCLSVASIAHHEFSIVTDCAADAAPQAEWHGYLPVVLFSLYMCLYSVGWGPIVMLVYSEIMYFDKWFSSLIYACGQFAMFLVVYAFFDTNTSSPPPAPQTRGYVEYALWAYAASCFVSVAFVCFFVPETRALRLNRIQAAFDDKRDQQRGGDRALRRVRIRK